MTGRFDEQRDSLALECPECGAQPGKRCGWWQEPVNNPGYPLRRRWKHHPRLVHDERVLAAWRAAPDVEVAAR